MSAYGPLAEFYDRLTEDVNYPELFGFLRRLWADVQPRRVLDMACGTGSLSMLMAEAGLDVVGMDLSPDMIARAREKAGGCADAPPEFLVGDMGDFRLSVPVDAAVCMLDSFNYLLDPADGVQALRCFYDGLRPGGMLIYDIRPRRQLMAFDGQVFLDETEDVCCLWRTEFDREENLCFYGMDIFIRESENLWRREREEHWEYAYRLRWLRMQMERIGFRDIRFYGNRTLTAPGSRENRVFITGRKEDPHCLTS